MSGIADSFINRVSNWCSRPDAEWEQKARSITVAVVVVVLPILALFAIQGGLPYVGHAIGHLFGVSAAPMIQPFSEFVKTSILGASPQTYLMFFTLIAISGVGIKLLIGEIIPEKYQGASARLLTFLLPLLMTGTGMYLMFAGWNQSHSVVQALVNPPATAKLGLIVAGAGILSAAAIPLALRGITITKPFYWPWKQNAAQIQEVELKNFAESDKNLVKRKEREIKEQSEKELINKEEKDISISKQENKKIH